jgi:hypothetical protein
MEPNPMKDIPWGAGTPTGGPKDRLNNDLQTVADLMHRRYDSLLGAPAVTARLGSVADRFDDATVRTFVPLLVRRYTEEELADEAGTRSVEVTAGAAVAG